MLGFIIDCFSTVFNCDPGQGPNPAPEINATHGVVAIALLLSVGAIIYRQWQQHEFQ